MNTTINFFFETEKKIEKIMNIINLEEISSPCFEKSR